MLFWLANNFGGHGVLGKKPGTIFQDKSVPKENKRFILSVELLLKPYDCVKVIFIKLPFPVLASAKK